MSQLAVCPKCGMRSEVVLSYPVRATHKIVDQNNDTLLVSAVPLNEDPPGGELPYLRCKKCDVRWGIPKGITVMAMEGGDRLVILGPDRR